MTAEERVKEFWPFWIVRVLWLLLSLAIGWWLNERTMSEEVLGGVGAALLIQALLFLFAWRKRLPPAQAVLSAAAAAGVASLLAIRFPNHLELALLLGVVPFLDLARWRGALVFLLFLLFPLPALAYELFLREGAPAPDWLLVGSWALATLLGSRLVQATLRGIARAEPSPEPSEAQSPEKLLAKVAQALARETKYERIMEVLVRNGAEVLDSGQRRRARARAMALTFKPGLADVLTVAALCNMESNTIGPTFELKGVLGTLMRDGEPIDTDGSQPPFDQLRVLEGHRVLLFPLSAGIDVYGAAMFATKDQERAESEEVQRVLLAMVDQASLALHSAVLQQALRRDQDQRLGGEGEARHQLARDLHDGPVQRVAAISMQLEFVKALMKRQPERALEEIEQLQQVAKQASQEMRTMLFTLRPVVLESEGLAPALETFIERLKEQDRLNITFKADPLPRLDSKVEDVAFAILQEAIGNAKKYSGGAPIHVRIIKGQSMVVGQVEDEGPGFDLAAVTANYGSRASLGLLNMQERAAMVGGQLRIDTAPGKGTVVSITVPVLRD